METEKTDTIEQQQYPLRQIYFYLTEGCNLACRHCWIDPKHQTGEKKYPALPLKLFQSVIEQAKPLGLSGVKLSGGEPLLHPQLHDILNIIQDEKLRIGIETNGTLCTSEIANKIAECKNPFVSVSLDGANAETHEWMRGVKGSFEAAIKGIHNLVNAGLRPQIIMTITHRNKNQIEAVIRLAEKLGSNSIKIGILQSIGRGKQMHNCKENISIEELITIGQWIERDISKSTKIHIFYSHPLAFRPIGKMFGEKLCIGGCDIKRTIGILSDGSYALCGIGNIANKLIFGNIETDNLSNIWNKNDILVKIRKGIPNNFKGICSKCLMKKVCEGHCIANTFYKTGNFFEPYWYCNDAEEKNIFPVNRKC